MFLRSVKKNVSLSFTGIQSTGVIAAPDGTKDHDVTETTEMVTESPVGTYNFPAIFVMFDVS